MKKLCDEILAGKKNEDSIKMMFLKVKIAKKMDMSKGMSPDMSANLCYKKVR